MLNNDSFTEHRHENTRHLIGKELPYTDTLPAATGTASVGVSEIPARADHVHGLGTAASSALATDWTAVSFSTNWSDFGGGYQVTQYCKDSMGFVHVRGLTTGTAGRGSNNMFTLPTGFRPTAGSLIFAQDRGAGGVGTLYASLQIDAAGVVSDRITALATLVNSHTVNFDFYAG